MKRFLDRIKPGRKIDANSAVLLPFTPDGKPDYAEFERHLLRTAKAGITPAVNMDTGFGPQLTPALRVEVLKLTRKALGTATFIAGAGPFGETYEQAVKSILDVGATPIIFQSEQFSSGDVVALDGRELRAEAGVHVDRGRDPRLRGAEQVGDELVDVGLAVAEGQQHGGVRVDLPAGLDAVQEPLHGFCRSFLRISWRSLP